MDEFRVQPSESVRRRIVRDAGVKWVGDIRPCFGGRPMAMFGLRMENKTKAMDLATLAKYEPTSAKNSSVGAMCLFDTRGKTEDRGVRIRETAGRRQPTAKQTDKRSHSLSTTTTMAAAVASYYVRSIGVHDATRRNS
ncbi:hypothetical protein U1Q18_051314 [Sarracenia purpurea var. burkii]